MKYLYFPEELSKTTIRLNPEEKTEPSAVIREFFSFYNLNDIRLEIGNLLEIVMASEGESMQNSNDRVNLIQFGYQLEAVLEAALLLMNRSSTKNIGN